MFRLFQFRLNQFSL